MDTSGPKPTIPPGSTEFRSWFTFPPHIPLVCIKPGVGPGSPCFCKGDKRDIARPRAHEGVWTTSPRSRRRAGGQASQQRQPPHRQLTCEPLAPVAGQLS